MQTQLVWDVPTRAFHWLLVGLLGFSWWSAETHHMDWHQYSGITVCGLMMFRLMWGFIGSSTARFARFVKGPRAVLSYLTATDVTAQSATPGHNPLGGWSVVALLLATSAQFISGLFAVDIDGIESGSLSYLLDFDQGRAAAKLHKTSFNVLLLLVGVHVLAILFYLLIKRRDLIKVMITGLQTAAADEYSTQASLAPRWRFALAVVMSALLAYTIATGFKL